MNQIHSPTRPPAAGIAPDWESLLQRLSEPFNANSIQWRAGSTNKDKTKALALAYADARVYEARLDDTCPGAWEVTFEPWGDNRIICRLTIHGITRSSTGEDTSNADNSGTTAEAQAFKRACSKFGLGRYLYDLPATWVPYDANTKRLKATPEIPHGTSQHPTITSDPVEPVGIGSQMAAAMHRELTKAGLAQSEHYQLASKVTGRVIQSLANLDEEEARKVWAMARHQPALN